MAKILDFFSKKQAIDPKVMEIAKEISAKPELKRSFEQFLDSSAWVRALMSGTVGGIKDKFMTDIYKETIMYPHEEMLLAKKAVRNCAWLNSAVRTRGNMMLGGKVQVTSKDEKSVVWFNEMLKKTRLSKYAELIGADCASVGNWYAERIRDGGRTVVYEYIMTPERMYADVDEKGLIKRWLLETPEIAGGSSYGTIQYYGDRRRTIKGKFIPKEKILHIKRGVAEIPPYGRGPVCSVVNDYRVLLEIERALAVIARYKAIPKKLIMLNRGDDAAGGKTAEYYANQISNLSDIENPVLPEVATVADLSYSGKDVNFEPIVNYLKRKMTIALVPSFLMHGEETNYAVSRDQKETWLLEIQSDREAVGDVIVRELRMLADEYGKRVPEDLEVVFGEVDLGQNEQTIEATTKLFQANLITLNEARERLKLPALQGNGELLYSELSSASQLFGGQSGEPEGNDNEDPNTQNFKIDI